MRFVFILILLALSHVVIAQPLNNFAQPFSYEDPFKQEAISIDDFRISENNFIQNNDDVFAPIRLGREKAGVAFLYSAIVPGLGQATNGKWGRAGLYFATEVLSIAFHVDQMNKARSRERNYESFANSEWSVIAYSQWLVNYYDENGLSHPRLQELRNSVVGTSAQFNFDVETQLVDIELLNQIEVETPFVFTGGREGSNFSHVLPRYGSQQYYELVSKYFQFQSGWRDFYEQNTLDPTHQYQYAWDGTEATPLFFNGVDQAATFNDNYRTAGNLMTLLIVNHIVSAFDALFTVKLNNSRIKAEMNMLNQEQLSIRYSF